MLRCFPRMVAVCRSSKSILEDRRSGLLLCPACLKMPRCSKEWRLRQNKELLSRCEINTKKQEMPSSTQSKKKGSLFDRIDIVINAEMHSNLLKIYNFIESCLEFEAHSDVHCSQLIHKILHDVWDPDKCSIVSIAAFALNFLNKNFLHAFSWNFLHFFKAAQH